jgi:hypothetical protein
MPGGVMFFQTPGSSAGAVAGRLPFTVVEHFNVGAPLPASPTMIGPDPPLPPMEDVPA